MTIPSNRWCFLRLALRTDLVLEFGLVACWFGDGLVACWIGGWSGFGRGFQNGKRGFPDCFGTLSRTPFIWLFQNRLGAGISQKVLQLGPAIRVFPAIPVKINVLGLVGVSKPSGKPRFPF